MSELRPIQRLGDLLKEVLPSASPNASSGASARPSTEPSYACPLCQDSHILHPRSEDGQVDYTRTTPCRCIREQMEREVKERLLRYCRLPRWTEHMTFANYQHEDNPSLKAARDVAMQLSQGDEAVRWLTIAAGVDRGKTHLAVAICRRWLERGVLAIYANVPDLMLTLKDGFDLEGEESYRQARMRFCNVPLLVMDDLGMENKTPWVREQIQLIINHRYEYGLALVVTTNRPLMEIVNDQAGPRGTPSEDSQLASRRIASRLQREDWCKVVILKAPEHRLTKGEANA